MYQENIKINFFGHVSQETCGWIDTLVFEDENEKLVDLTWNEHNNDKRLGLAVVNRLG